MHEAFDVAIVGAGGAGLSLLAQLPGTGLRAVLVDPVQRSGADRTWCFWDAGRSDVDACVHRTWRTVDVIGRDGAGRRLDLRPMRYAMVRSADFYDLAGKAAAEIGALRVDAAAEKIIDGEDAALVQAGGRSLTARWVFDSRPAAPARPARTAWLQHFRGWTVRFPAPVVDPDTAVLMDFSLAQPAHGAAFGYVLPLDARQALVEYTQLSPQRLGPAEYDAALRQYLRQRYGAAGAEAAVLHVEDGAIPMTDAVYRRRVGRRVFRIGTAGGATRASTGYTFAAMQRQARQIAVRLAAGQDPMPPPAYPARHRWMDGVLLRALDRGLTPGPELFMRLFERNPAPRILRFLDGQTRVREDLLVMRSAPLRPMLLATAGDALARLQAGVTRGAGRASA